MTRMRRIAIGALGALIWSSAAWAQEDVAALTAKLKKDFSAFAAAVKSGKGEAISNWDASVADGTQGKLPSEAKSVIDAFKARLTGPARLEVSAGFGSEVDTSPVGHPVFVLLRNGNISEQAESIDWSSANVRARITFPAGKGPVFVEKVDVKNFNAAPQGSLGLAPIKPQPLYNATLFDPDHPFLKSARFRQWELALQSRVVQAVTATFTFRSPSQPKGKFLFSNVIVDIGSMK